MACANSYRHHTEYLYFTTIQPNGLCQQSTTHELDHATGFKVLEIPMERLWNKVFSNIKVALVTEMEELPLFQALVMICLKISLNTERTLNSHPSPNTNTSMSMDWTMQNTIVSSTEF